MDKNHVDKHHTLKQIGALTLQDSAFYQANLIFLSVLHMKLSKSSCVDLIFSRTCFINFKIELFGSTFKKTSEKFKFEFIESSVIFARMLF